MAERETTGRRPDGSVVHTLDWGLANSSGRDEVVSRPDGSQVERVTTTERRTGEDGKGFTETRSYTYRSDNGESWELAESQVTQKADPPLPSPASVEGGRARATGTAPDHPSGPREPERLPRPDPALDGRGGTPREVDVRDLPDARQPAPGQGPAAPSRPEAVVGTRDEHGQGASPGTRPEQVRQSSPREFEKLPRPDPALDGRGTKPPEVDVHDLPDVRQPAPGQGPAVPSRPEAVVGTRDEHGQGAPPGTRPEEARPWSPREFEKLPRPDPALDGRGGMPREVDIHDLPDAKAPGPKQPQPGETTRDPAVRREQPAPSPREVDHGDRPDGKVPGSAPVPPDHTQQAPGTREVRQEPGRAQPRDSREPSSRSEGPVSPGSRTTPATAPPTRDVPKVVRATGFGPDPGTRPTTATTPAAPRTDAPRRGDARSESAGPAADGGRSASPAAHGDSGTGRGGTQPPTGRGAPRNEQPPRPVVPPAPPVKPVPVVGKDNH